MNNRPAAQPPGASWLRTGYRLIFIGLAMVLLAATAYVLGTSWLAGQSTAALDQAPEAQEIAPTDGRRPVEGGSLYYLAEMARYTARVPASPAPTRTLARFYANRAYDGAPPWIPHPVEDAMAVGGAACLQCHQTGGYVPPMQAYAPVAPHPELTSCTQCHVPARAPEVDLFDQNTFTPAPPPALGGEAYPGAPPPVPHPVTLQMRENCAACHMGPAAPAEIRTDHLERDHCLQCHVPNLTEAVWTREEGPP